MLTESETQERLEGKRRAVVRPYVATAVALALLGGTILRFSGLTSPPYDNHNFRQCQTLSTIESFYREGIDLLHPKTLCTGYPGTVALELPVFQALAASLYHLFGPHLEVIRLLNILFGAATTWVLYRTVAYLLHDSSTAIAAAIIYWLAPLNILFQRSMLIDPMAVFCGLVSFYSLALFLRVSSASETISARNNDLLCFGILIVSTWLTAMLKALYLWPVVLLFGCAIWLRRFRIDRSLVISSAVFLLCGASLLVWNHHTAAINRTNPLIPGWRLTALLGFSGLFSPDFYIRMLRSAPRWWLGAAFILYPVGLWACWLKRSDSRTATILALLVLIPPTYLAAFANINKPHEYYQLIVTPFLSIVAACGALWLMATPWFAARLMRSQTSIVGLSAFFVLAAVGVYSIWLRWPALDHRIEKFGELCNGRFPPWSASILFVDSKTDGYAPVPFVPAYQYAGKLWGWGMTVTNVSSTSVLLGELAPTMSRLDLVVFYGTDFPTWLPQDKFHLSLKDDEHHLYAFSTASSGTTIPAR